MTSLSLGLQISIFYGAYFENKRLNNSDSHFLGGGEEKGQLIQPPKIIKTICGTRLNFGGPSGKLKKKARIDYCSFV